MRKLILTFVLGTLCLCAFSQEAFYIYRHDGDFNGFFYDEVIEMRQSKIGVDSVEYDKWVTQEVVLADTIYRIPLAAIDSIGFQQPEIKFNPKVKFLQVEGLTSYLKQVSDIPFRGHENTLTFENLPANLTPQVGDVLIGLETDDCSMLYVSDEMTGSVSCVVEEVQKSGDKTYVYGHSVTQLGDVFEQFITVEQIGIDTAGNIHRRIAGCTPEGFPRNVVAKSGEGEINLVDFGGSFSKSWNIPKDSTQVDLTLDANFQVKFRVAYNIGWTSLFVKLSREYRMRVKPSIGLTVKREFKVSTDDLIETMPKVLFPAACPIFETKPFPALFLHASGSIEARLNLPQVYLGFAEDITIETPAFLPFRYWIRWAPDENTTPTSDMLDLSASIRIQGTIYTGIEFQAIVNTASWFSKILQCGIGLHFYFGPKATAEFTWNRGLLEDTDDYYNLFNSRIGMSFISLGMDATAKAQIGWGDKHEETFFSGSKDFLQYNFRLAPLFEQTTVEEKSGYEVITLYPRINEHATDMILVYNAVSAGIFDPNDTSKSPVPVKESSIFPIAKIEEGEKFVYNVSYGQLKAKRYIAKPIVHGMGESINVDAAGASFNVPAMLDMETDMLHFDVAGNPDSIFFVSNCEKGYMWFVPGSLIQYSPFVSILPVSESENRYLLRCNGHPNYSLFSHLRTSPGDSLANGPSINYMGVEDGEMKKLYLGITQEQNDLAEVEVGVSCDLHFLFSDGLNIPSRASFSDTLRGRRDHNDMVYFTGSKTSTNGNASTYSSMDLFVHRADFDSTRMAYKITLSGHVFERKTFEGRTETETSISFDNVIANDACPGCGSSILFTIEPTNVTSASYKVWYWTFDGDGHATSTTKTSTSFDANSIYGGGAIVTKVPGEE